jgi:hypothetical protein
MTRDSAPLTILVVSHTHWDREWYHSAARFRQRLVPLVDELLSAPPDEPPFLLDGQSIVIEDYLAVRPAARDALARALREGRLEAGPWYVLADEMIPGGEALVRNLLAGRRTLAELGARAPQVLYSPDAFGHPAALPALASGFDLPLAILWRGLGGPAWPPGDTFRWSAPDDSSVLVHHLPPDGYEFGSTLPTEAEAAARRWRNLEAAVASRAGLNLVLLMNGADHHARQRDLETAVEALASAARPAQVRRTGLREAARELLERASHREPPRISGELRASFGYTWSLQGTFAVRAPLKRRAVRLERELLRDVEPWLAIGRHAPSMPAVALEHAAWKTLLRCHPHDTLCGCSIDEVARAMAARLDAGEAEAAGLRTDALHAILGHDPDCSAGKRPAWTPAVVVRNRAPRRRGGVAELELIDFARDVPVGPGSAFAQPSEEPEEPLVLAGGAIAFQHLDSDARVDRIEPRRRYPDADLVRVRRVVAWIPDAPAYGVTCLAQEKGDSPAPGGSVTATDAGDGEIVMQNEWLRVSGTTAGPLSIATTDGARLISAFLELEDTGDAGDSYTPSLIEPTVRGRQSRAVQLVHRGPLRGELRAQFVLDVPECSTRDGRSAVAVPLPVEVSFVLDAGARFVRMRVQAHNGARDHRLRVLLDGALANGELWADAAFGAVRREPHVVTPAHARLEAPLPTAPLHRYVTVANAAAGLTVFANGATEYEALPDGRIAVTLSRGVGALSRPELPERPGHAGWPADIPEAQCLGPVDSDLAVMLHGPRTDSTVDLVERTADDVLHPLVGGTIRDLIALPQPFTGVALEGEGLAFGACKRSDDGEWMVLRCVNLLEREIRGRWRLAEPPREVRASDLDERIGDPVPAAGSDIAVTAAPRAIVTLLVR